MVCDVFADARAVGSAEFGSSSLPIKLDEVRCSGTESSLVNCNFVSRHDCSNIEDAGVICNETCMSRGYYLVILFFIRINAQQDSS